ncbi:hypothetical protein [Erwinia phage Snitter]|nr:hypothetical protein [Erwinia phage Snitter]
MSEPQFNPYESPETLRQAFRMMAQSVALGERDEAVLPWYLVDTLDAFEADKHKFTLSYIRTIMNRVPEVRERGTISASFKLDDGMKMLIVSMNAGKMQKGARRIDRDNATAIDIARSKIKGIMKFNPDITNLPEGNVDAAINIINQYRDFFSEFLAGEKK